MASQVYQFKIEWRMKILIPEIMEKLKNHIPTPYGDTLTKIILFDSQTRGDATENSDIDILIITKEYLSQSLKKTNIIIS
ncbi:nucleotidyltransferase domain-containing protein [Synechocystis salina LEGE 06155]|nr:nucleotidyltransferase domain-containing protein [Synechocystis salina LEGE 06155]